MQKFIAIGRIGNDPELRDVQGTKVASFSLATSKKWTDKQGEKKEATEWHNCVAWEKKAELIGQYVKKGDQLYIEGELKTDKYEKDGQTHYSTKITITSMEFIGGKKETEPQTEQAQTQQSPGQRMADGKNDEDDLPFRYDRNINFRIVNKLPFYA